MNKQEFFEKLSKGLCGLPQSDIEERLNFYSEMIDDRIEEGFSEEDAVRAVGSIDEIISQVVEDIPLTKLVKENITPKKKLTALEIVLLVLGSPIWLSLFIALFAVVLSLYVSLWSIIISLWAVFVSLVAGAVGTLVSGAVFTVTESVLSGVALISAGIVCAGLSIFMFYGCKTATKGILILTKKLLVGIKNCFIKKGDA